MARVRNPVVPEDIAKQLIYKCMICANNVEGWYGSHEGGGTCSRKCEKEQMAKPRFPGHSAEDFEALMGEKFSDSSFQLDGDPNGSPNSR